MKNIEASNTTPMMRQYFSIKEKNPDCLLFFRLGDFYELFFQDAIETSKALDITLTKRGKSGEGKDIPMCGVPVHAYEAYLARLIRQGYSVAIVDQVEKPEDAKKRGAGSIVKRDVVRIVTPGTLTEDTLLEAGQNNYLASISLIKNNNLSVAYVDISTGQFFIEDANKKGLLSILTRMQPKEILISESVYGSEEIREIWQYWSKKIKILPDVRFNKQSGENQMLKAFNVASIYGLGDFSETRIQAVGALLDYVHLTQQGRAPRLESPKIINTGNFVQMDSATFRSLELLQTQQGQRKGSLFHCLNKTVTASGARLLASRISLPFREKKDIEARLDVVNYMINSFKSVEKLRELLGKTVDVQRVISRISLGRAGPRDLGGLRDTLLSFGEIDKILEGAHREEQSGTFQGKLVEALQGFDSLWKLLDDSLQDELPLLARDGGFIKSSYDQELGELRNLKNTSFQKIKNMQKMYSSCTGVSNLKIKHNNMLGYYIEVTSINAAKLQENNDFIHRQTLANNMRFSTKELVELEQNLSQMQEKTLHIELKIFSEIIEAILKKTEELIKASRSLAELDLLISFALIAKQRGYVRADIENSEVVEIEEGRHPVVESSKIEGTSFISNDCFLTSEKNIWVITGPNMAGKSTFLRQNALIVLMAQMGSFIPAKKAKIGLVDRIFSRVGASDDLARGQSTFMVEMLETALILNQATEKSFVILDEVGRGTATYDGLSIAWSCLEYIHRQNKSRCLFATHYHELAEQENYLDRLAAYTVKVEEWEKKIVFLYKIIKGRAGRSYGIHVAELAGIPKSVIDRAKILLKKLEKENKKSSLKPDDRDMPLFQEEDISALEQKKALKIYEKLEGLDLNNISPRQALDLLYQLKG